MNDQDLTQPSAYPDCGQTYTTGGTSSASPACSTPQRCPVCNGNGLVPLEDEAVVARSAALKLIEAVDHHYPDSPEFASLYVEAKELLGI